jgi:N-methylhydantoinase A/oxoprolinase/acetone carboxylase beta subunit
VRLVGVDVGGTFTDIVYSDTERAATLVHKVHTTPGDPSRGVMQGIRELCERHGIATSSVDHVFHGTTIATNAVLEYRGARTGMVTTRGYRDIIHVARHQRPQHYSILQELPWQNRPLVRRRHRKVVTERLVPPRGEVLAPLAEDEVRRAARELRDEGVEAVAVCFLFSYLDPRHEERARGLVLEEHPGAFVTTSASVSPQFREFERFTTAAMNAFIGPLVRGYVGRLAGSLREAGLRADLKIMASNGGVATPSMVVDRPVVTLLSGPAAGVLGGAWAGELSGRRRLITFDVGGTSADIGIVVDGVFSEATARDTWIAGYPLLTPMIDVHTIGAGGGSIAHIDRGGAFRVGPRSAGAEPGPAAYGRGGTEPTVTDANLVLGRLDRDSFLGGEMALDPDAARRAVAALAGRLGLGEIETAEGVLTILNSNMASAIRSRTVQKGIDPRQFALVAFGGAGPLHGVEVAAMLGIPEVVVPPHPGITSAVGLLTTDLKYDAVKTEFQVRGAIDLARLNAHFDDMRRDLAAQLQADGFAPGEVAFVRAGDLRYAGQGYELRVPVPDGRIDDAALDALWMRFHRLHEAEYGHAFPASPVEIVNIRLTGVGRMPKIGRPAAPPGRSLGEARVKVGPCVFRVDGKLARFETGFYRRDLLPRDQELPGPAIILQRDSTTLIPPGSSAVADGHGNLMVRVGGPP